ncbi:MAG: DUF1883 domain-containing protein [Methanotrichaceae archaeon]
MDYAHYELDLGRNDVVKVEVDRQANVVLLDEVNYQRYRRRQRFEYCGGLQKQSPMHLRAPRQGHWHLVVDLAGSRGTIRTSVKVIRG